MLKNNPLNKLLKKWDMKSLHNKFHLRMITMTWPSDNKFLQAPLNSAAIETSLKKGEMVPKT